MEETKSDITNEQFKEAFLVVGSNYAAIARYIEDNFGVSYTRAAAAYRAKRFPELQDKVEKTHEKRAKRLIREAEQRTLELINSEDEKIALGACEKVFKYAGHLEGYSEKATVDVTGDLGTFTIK